VYQQDNRLIARVNIDQDTLDQEFASLDLSEPDAERLLLRLLEEVRADTNKRLPDFSAIRKIMVQPEPFELTPTKKVKRYLYTN